MGTSQNKRSYVFLTVLVILLFISLNMLFTPNNETPVSTVIQQEAVLDTIDWERSFSSVAKEMESNRNYFADRIVLELHEGNREVFIGVELKDVPDKVSLISYLESIIYLLSKEASQSNGMRLPNKQSLDYGEVFDCYNIRVGVYKDAEYDTPDKWLVHYRIPKGSHKKIQIR